MQQILNGDVLHMIPIPNGVVAAVLNEVTGNGKMAVEYRLISLENGEVQRVSSSIYSLSKFGPGHKNIELQLDDHLNCRCCTVADGGQFIIEFGGICKLLDAEGYSKWKGPVAFNGESPCDAAFDGKFLWLCYPEQNTVVRYRPDGMVQNLRIGGKSATNSFRGPCGLYFNGGLLFVCNNNANSVWQINTCTFGSSELYEFGEPVFQYAKVLEKEVVRLESGLYIL